MLLLSTATKFPTFFYAASKTQRHNKVTFCKNALALRQKGSRRNVYSWNSGWHKKWCCFWHTLNFIFLSHATSKDCKDIKIIIISLYQESIGNDALANRANGGRWNVHWPNDCWHKNMLHFVMGTKFSFLLNSASETDRHINQNNVNFNKSIGQ